MTGKPPVPIPTTNRRHFHGISSFSDSGVCPRFAILLGRFLFALGHFARVDHDIVIVVDSIDPNRSKGKSIELHIECPQE
jgi:hypothetical protein